jgi:lipopolysaccharide/colanic/teichoic acid biosynthesis glycosyltransferase
MKRVLDAALALTGIAVFATVLAPLLVLIAVAVKLESRGPVLFAAERVGRAGRRFRMRKFRTMRVDAGGPRVTTAEDPRVTRVGRLLRRTHFDEAPQLWNVLVGDMSLVGPRPEDPRFVDEGDPAQRRVLSVRPGITGPSQLAFAGREGALLGREDPERDYRERVLPAKLAADAAYVERRSFAGDLAILARTLFRRPDADA